MNPQPFNSLIAREFAEYVRKRWGEDVTLNALATELLGIIPMVGLDTPPEDDILKGILPWTARLNLVASLGNFSHVGIMTIDPRVVCVITAITINGVAGQTYDLQLASNITRDTSPLLLSRDLRTSKVASSLGLTRTQAAQQGSTVWRETAAVAGPLKIETGPWILGSAVLNNAIAVVGDVVNQAVEANFAGYERALKPEEQSANL